MQIYKNNMYKQLIMLTIAVMYAEDSIIPYHNLLSEDLMQQSTDKLNNYDLKTHQNLPYKDITEHKLYLLSNQNPAFITSNYTRGEYFIEFKKTENLIFWSFIGLDVIWYTYVFMQYKFDLYAMIGLAAAKSVNYIFFYIAYYTKLLDYNYWIQPIFHNSAYTEETAKEYLLSNKKDYDNIIFYTRLKWVSLFIANIGIKYLALQYITHYQDRVYNNIIINKLIQSLS